MTAQKKTCLVSGTSCDLDARTCPACGEASWSAEDASSAPPAPQDDPREALMDEMLEHVANGDDAEALADRYLKADLAAVASHLLFDEDGTKAELAARIVAALGGGDD